MKNSIKCDSRPTIVITSIHGPNDAVRAFAAGAKKNGMSVLVIGDLKSSPNYLCDGVMFMSVDDQKKTGFAYAEQAPTNHYARKNLGYLFAIRNRSPLIIDTDDDNLPYESFWRPRTCELSGDLIENGGWVNVYGYFTDEQIWPRGLPLDALRGDLPDGTSVRNLACPIQQGLANRNPDVDAVYRLVFGVPERTFRDAMILLGTGSWCPFNSQNTSWWPQAYALLYLPTFCSFRMTDIWRSFVAQRIAWANDWPIAFHGPTVFQDRNFHNLMRDFEDEVPGYLLNRDIADRLGSLAIKPGIDAIYDNLRLCYTALIDMNAVGQGEIDLLGAWIADLESFGATDVMLGNQIWQ